MHYVTAKERAIMEMVRELVEDENAFIKEFGGEIDPEDPLRTLLVIIDKLQLELFQYQETVQRMSTTLRKRNER